MPNKIFDRLPDPYKIDTKSKEKAMLELNEDPSTVKDNVHRFREMVQGTIFLQNIIITRFTTEHFVTRSVICSWTKP